MKCPAPLLGVITVTDKVTEDHLQTLFIMTHLPLWQRCSNVLQRQPQLQLINFRSVQKLSYITSIPNHKHFKFNLNLLLKCIILLIWPQQGGEREVKQ